MWVPRVDAGTPPITGTESGVPYREFGNRLGGLMGITHLVYYYCVGTW